MTAPAGPHRPRAGPDGPADRAVDRRARRNPLRRQPPVHSPIGLRGLTMATLEALGLRVGPGSRRRAGAGSRARSLRQPADPAAALRDLLRREYAAEEATLYGSGTDALRVAIGRAARDANCNVVALPAFTCFDVATAAVGAGARIRLYDIDPATLGPDPADLERVLEAGARVVVVTPLYGVPVDWEMVAARVAAHGAIAIEDAAQGHGAAWRGRPLGSHGRLSVLSFGRGKGWTGAGGGALLARPDASARPAPAGGVGRTRHQTDGAPPTSTDPPPVRPSAGAAAELRTLAAAAAQWALGRPNLYGLPRRVPWLGLGRTTYRRPSKPTGLPRTAAALLLASRAAADREAAARRERARLWLERLRGAEHLRPIRIPPDAAPGFLRLPVRRVGESPAPRRAERARQLGVAPSYPTTLAALPAVRARLLRNHPGWPGARALVRELLTVPTHSLVRPEECAELLRLLGAPRRGTGGISGTSDAGPRRAAATPARRRRGAERTRARGRVRILHRRPRAHRN